MNQARYTHISIIKENKLFVLGGRIYGDDEEALLNHVECFDIIAWIKLRKQKKIINNLKKNINIHDRANTNNEN